MHSHCNCQHVIPLVSSKPLASPQEYGAVINLIFFKKKLSTSSILIHRTCTYL
jgi:hypothetical protein